MTEQKETELTSLHKYIKTTTTYRTTLTENNPKTRRMTPIIKTAKKELNEVLQEGKRSDLDGTQAPSR